MADSVLYANSEKPIPTLTFLILINILLASLFHRNPNEEIVENIPNCRKTNYIVIAKQLA